MSENEALKEMIRVLWNRVRLLEMVVVRQADNKETSGMLHGLRSSLYETGDYYGIIPSDSFQSILEKLQSE